jgi:osmotically-inducible protein OsmY
MDERRQDTGREERYERSQGWDEESQRGVTTQSRSGSEPSRSGGSRGSGDWQGYVVPYRYYGPGYQGVGYYSVMYQGPGEEGTSGQGGQTWQQAGDQGPWQREQDRAWQQGYGQGQPPDQSGYGRQGAYAGRGGFEPTGGGRSGSGGDYWQSGYGRSGYQGMSPGQFTGRGPRNYQRSDDRLRDEVCDRLMEHGQLDASEVDVQVRNGEVTLSGTVPERSMKRLAEDAAESVMGVRDVMNQLRVEGGESRSTTTRSTGSGRSSTSRSTKESTKEMASSHETTPNGNRQPSGSGTR